MFALACAFEVIEHIEDDEGSLRLWRKHIRPGGWVMLSTPPFQSRFGPLDRGGGHYRRYEPDWMAELLVKTGFKEPRIWLYGFPLGYALEAARNGLATLSRKEKEGESFAERTEASGQVVAASRLARAGDPGGVSALPLDPATLPGDTLWDRVVRSSAAPRLKPARD